MKYITGTSYQQFKNHSRQYSDASIFMHQAIADRAGLSGTDHKYLGIILKYNKLTAGELSKLTGLSTGAVTGLLDRLEKKNLLKRTTTKEDRRKVIIVANEKKAMELLEPLFEELQIRTDELISALTENELNIIENYFIKATQIMTDITLNLKNTSKK